MKRFDVAANIFAGVVIWPIPTGIVLLFLNWRDVGPPAPLWPSLVVIAISLVTLALYVRRYWKKLSR